MPEACIAERPAMVPSRMAIACSMSRDWALITRSTLTPSMSSITRMGFGRAPASKVTNRAMFGCSGIDKSAPASSRNSLRNSFSLIVRAAVALYSGTFRANRSALASWRSSARFTTKTVPTFPPPSCLST